MNLKVLLAVLMVAGLLAVALGTTTVFAQDPPAVPPDTTWSEMQQACVNGDFEAMQKLHEENCGGDGTTPGGMMGGQGGMMGGQGGMMGNGGGIMGGGWNGGGMMGNW